MVMNTMTEGNPGPRKSVSQGNTAYVGDGGEEMTLWELKI